jgi:hypothetical protein
MGDDAGQAHRTTQKTELSTVRERERGGWTSFDEEVYSGVAKEAHGKQNDTHFIDSPIVLGIV